MFLRRSLLVLTLWSCGCSLDTRQLQLAKGDDQGLGSSGGQPGDGPDGSDAGGPRSPDTLVDGCADLDTDGVPDCQVTLVQNPSFTSDTSDWVADSNTTLTWDMKNALDDLPSGSAKLSTTTPRGSASQCVPLSGQQLVIAYADAFVETNDATGTPAQASLEISFFDAGDCQGASARYFDTPPSSVLDAWTVIQAGNTSSSTTQSVSIALVAQSGSGSSVNAYFDNVMLKAKPL
jgi:hypothetical protein